MHAVSDDTRREILLLIKSGAFPVVRMPNGEARIDPTDVAAWIASKKKTEGRY